MDWVTVGSNGKHTGDVEEKPKKLSWGGEDRMCDICDEKEPDSVKKLAHIRSNEFAHKYASLEADKMDKTHASWVEWYVIFYRKIYDHEFQRNILYEREKFHDVMYRKYRNSSRICCYHSENIEWLDDGTHDRVQKEFREEYEQSCWPNKHQGYFARR
jgi:hypothetical protein